ncbi:hypothetical protein M0802_003461 [Mischocyttarus mexicanus]|nr:hypothetical protein M0802_003461 [Mischocyttarus mexicanus]
MEGGLCGRVENGEKEVEGSLAKRRKNQMKKSLCIWDSCTERGSRVLRVNGGCNCNLYLLLSAGRIGLEYAQTSIKQIGVRGTKIASCVTESVITIMSPSHERANNKIEPVAAASSFCDKFKWPCRIFIGRLRWCCEKFVTVEARPLQYGYPLGPTYGTLLGSSQRVSRLRSRKRPHTVEAHGYKSSRSIQFQPVTNAEKSCRYPCAGISYQLGTGFHASGELQL